MVYFECSEYTSAGIYTNDFCFSFQDESIGLSGAVRRIYLIRHGHYYSHGPKTGHLDDVGKNL